MIKNAKLGTGSPSARSGLPSHGLVEGQPLRVGERPVKEPDTSKKLITAVSGTLHTKR